MTESGIYVITNVVSNKAYIGSTVNFKNRWAVHICYLQQGDHPNIHLQRSWNRHDKRVFEFSILEYLDILDELHLAEQFWIDVYREEGRELYNIAIPGKSPMLGRKHSKKTRRQISLSRQNMSLEMRAKYSRPGENNPFYGKHHTKEAKRKISGAKMGHEVSEETRRNVGIGHAKTYPAFVHKETGEIIPAGFNLSALCRELGVDRQGLNAVIHGRRPSYYGWTLVDSN